MKYKIKKMQLLAIGVILFAVYSSLQAQSINQEKLEKIRMYIAEVRHPDSVDMLARIRSIEPTNPQAYLIMIADDSNQRAGVRMKAFGLLSNFPTDASVLDFLENRIQNNSINESYRAIATSSYVRGFYKGNKARVESTLKKVENDNSISVRQNASEILRKMKSGEEHPAGKNVSKKGEDHRIKK